MYNSFEEKVKYNFKNEVFEKHIGEEARTFHILNKSRPLLSISRIVKPLTEFRYWVIPKMYLLPSRLTGQLSHKLLEKSFFQNNVIQLSASIEELKMCLKDDYEAFLNLSKDKKEQVINNVNLVVYETFKIIKKFGIKILRGEKYICNQIYHGYIDLIGYINGKPAIFELKTTTLPTPKFETKLQLGLYKKIINEPDLQTYTIRFDLKQRKGYLEEIDTSDFDKMDYLVKNILGEKF